MYSPKISEDLIPDLYRLGKAKGKPMTTIVNKILAEALEKIKLVPEKRIKNVKVEQEFWIEVPKERSD